MASLGGCNDHYHKMLKPQGKGRMTPSTFSRNALSKGGVNSDLGGGAKSGVKQQLGAGKASDGNPGRQTTAGSGRR